MKEEVFSFGVDRSIVGVFTYSDQRSCNQYPCVIFINAGLIHSVGPNRVYVKIAREISNIGITSFRFDYSGIGDSKRVKLEKSSEHLNNREITQALDVVYEKTGIKEFILGGICSGAYDAFKFSFVDQRVVGLMLIDGMYHDQNNKLIEGIIFKAIQNSRIRYYKKNAFSIKRWKKVFKGKSNVINKNRFMYYFNLILKVPYKLVKKKEVQNNTISKFKPTFDVEEWKLLFDKKVKVLMVFCEGSFYKDIFDLTIHKQLYKYKNDSDLKVKVLKDVDHTFTPIWSQNLLSEIMIDWLKELNE